MSARLVVLATGGTGGHMFPAEALASILLARGHRVALLTDQRGQAFAERLPQVELHRIPAGRLDAGLLGKAKGIAEMMLGTLAAGKKLKALHPHVVVGFGGYPSVPTVLAASRQHIATVLHEQNALLGRANRFLAPRISAIATSFPAVLGMKPAEAARVTVTGNPVRPEIVARRGGAYTSPAAIGPINLLVTGGSQGARILSTVIPAALAQLPAALKARLAIAQQARPEDVERVRAAYAQSGIAAEIASFFHDVPERLARAQLVIARAGASTVAELCAIGRPAILVPYAHAADDHQRFNARAVEEAGGGWMMLESSFTPDALATRLVALFSASEQLSAAAAAAYGLGRPDAALRLAELVLGVAGSNGTGDNGTGLKERAA